MGKKKSPLIWGLLLLFFAFPGARLEGEIRSSDLNSTRSVLESEWLRLKLEVMGLRLSYPAYRINLELREDNRINFVFLASGGMADHLRDIGSSEAKQVLAYHAQGIRDQVGDLIRNEFPVLWATYESNDDFVGRFLVPGEDWDDPPRELAHWKGNSFYWKP